MTHVPFSVWMLVNMLFSIPETSWSKGYDLSSLVFRCYLTLLNQLFSVFWRGWHAICQMDQIRWLRPNQRNTIRIHWTSFFLRNSTLSLTYLPIHCEAWRVPFLQWEHWQMEQGYYTSSKSFNSGCNGLAGGGSKNSNAFLHSDRHHLPPSLLRIPGCNVVKKAGMLGF